MSDAPPSLNFAPELVFCSEVDGVRFYELAFLWQSAQRHPFFPVAVKIGEKYTVTVAERGAEYAANIRDMRGLDFYTEVMDRGAFEAKWREFYKALTTHSTNTTSHE